MDAAGVPASALPGDHADQGSREESEDAPSADASSAGGDQSQSQPAAKAAFEESLIRREEKRLVHAAFCLNAENTRRVARRSLLQARQPALDAALARQAAPGEDIDDVDRGSRAYLLYVYNEVLDEPFFAAAAEKLEHLARKQKFPLHILRRGEDLQEVLALRLRTDGVFTVVAFEAALPGLEQELPDIVRRTGYRVKPAGVLINSDSDPFVPAPGLDYGLFPMKIGLRIHASCSVERFATAACRWHQRARDDREFHVPGSVLVVAEEDRSARLAQQRQAMACLRETESPEEASIRRERDRERKRTAYQAHRQENGGWVRTWKRKRVQRESGNLVAAS